MLAKPMPIQYMSGLARENRKAQFPVRLTGLEPEDLIAYPLETTTQQHA